jgi:membrane protein DedA with SNARE-associated domain
MHELSQWILDSIRTHGALSVFIGVLIESVIVPVPSPLIIMGAGSILVPPDLAPLQAIQPIALRIVLPGAIASTIGAFIGYGIGYWGGRPVIERLGKFLGFGWDDVLGMEQRLMKSHPGLVIFLLRALPIIPLSLISAASGVIRLPAGAFTFWTFLGSIPRCFLLAYLGWFTRDAYQGLAHGLDKAESLVSAGIVLAVVIGVFALRRRMSSSK